MSGDHAADLDFHGRAGDGSAWSAPPPQAPRGKAFPQARAIHSATAARGSAHGTRACASRTAGSVGSRRSFSLRATQPAGPIVRARAERVARREADAEGPVAPADPASAPGPRLRDA